MLRCLELPVMRWKLASLYYNKCNLERNLFHKNE